MLGSPGAGRPGRRRGANASRESIAAARRLDLVGMADPLVRLAWGRTVPEGDPSVQRRRHRGITGAGRDRCSGCFAPAGPGGVETDLAGIAPEYSPDGGAHRHPRRRRAPARAGGPGRAGDPWVVSVRASCRSPRRGVHCLLVLVGAPHEHSRAEHLVFTEPLEPVDEVVGDLGVRLEEQQAACALCIAGDDHADAELLWGDLDLVPADARSRTSSRGRRAGRPRPAGPGPCPCADHRVRRAGLVVSSGRRRRSGSPCRRRCRQR